MEKSILHNMNEETLLVEAEKEVKKNVDELMVWLGGTVNYFIRSIKGLAELSGDKERLRSYVTARLFSNISRLSEVADIYFSEAENEQEEIFCKDELLHRIKHSFTDEEPIDYDELSLFYKNTISGILAENYDVLSTLRMHISALKFISKSCNDYGANLLQFVCNHIMRTENMTLGQRIGYLLCLVMSVKEVESPLMGTYADSIDSIIDKASVAVCMSVTADFINSKGREDEDMTED